MNSILFILALPCVVWAIVSSIMITAFLSRRGIRINLLFFRLLILKYIHQYYKITLHENGRPGPWFYSYIISMNLALVLVLLAIVLMV